MRAASLGTVPAPASVEIACQQDLEAELANIAMYDELLETVVEPDVARVFTANRAALLDLPAFRRRS